MNAREAIITNRDFQIQISRFKIYKCSRCRRNDLKMHYKFCPHCGVRLIFNISED